MGDEVIVERLTLLRNEVAYLKRERDALQRFQEYQDNIHLI